MWVILVLSVFTVADRIILTYRELRDAAAAGRRHEAPAHRCRSRMLWNAFFWTYERATWQYDLMVIAILAFVWLTPPDWLGDPTASGDGPIGWLLRPARGARDRGAADSSQRRARKSAGPTGNDDKLGPGRVTASRSARRARAIPDPWRLVAKYRSAVAGLDPQFRAPPGAIIPQRQALVASALPRQSVSISDKRRVSGLEVLSRTWSGACHARAARVQSPFAIRAHVPTVQRRRRAITAGTHARATSSLALP